MYLFTTMTFATVALLFSSLTIADNEVAEIVNVPDQNLRQLVLQIKNKYEHKGDQITQDDLQNIYFLDASGKQIRDLRGLEYCSNLAEARFGNNAILDVTPLASCANLQSLDLSHNKIVDVSPLGKITKLKYLNLAHNQVESLDGVEKLRSLNSLYASGNQIESIEPVRHLKRLWSLDLSRNRITNISSVSQLPRLKSLWLADNEIADLTSLNFHTSNLTTDLRRNKVVDVGPFVSMAQNLGEDGQQYLPFWRLYLAGNPLSASARADLASLNGLGVCIDLRDSANVYDKPIVGIADTQSQSR